MSESLDPCGCDGDLTGKAVTCTTCGLRKQPIGRAAPLEMAGGLCGSDCPGHREDPHPGGLWPGETLRDFGFCNHGRFRE